MAKKEEILNSRDLAALLQAVNGVRLLPNPPSVQHVQGVFNELGWERHHRNDAPSGNFYGRGPLQAAINAQADPPFVSFRLADLGEADISNRYDDEVAVLQGVAECLLDELAALSGCRLEDPGEAYDDPAMDYINPYYRRLGSWVLSIGLIHLGVGESVIIALRLAHWADLVDD